MPLASSPAAVPGRSPSLWFVKWPARQAEVSLLMAWKWFPMYLTILLRTGHLPVAHHPPAIHSHSVWLRCPLPVSSGMEFHDGILHYRWCWSAAPRPAITPADHQPDHFETQVDLEREPFAHRNRNRSGLFIAGLFMPNLFSNAGTRSLSMTLGPGYPGNREFFKIHPVSKAYRSICNSELHTKGHRRNERKATETQRALTGYHISFDTARHATDETPLSIRNFSYAEAQRMPGAVLDLSKAIQSYPGVLPKSTFGYNIVFRGGAHQRTGISWTGFPSHPSPTSACRAAAADLTDWSISISYRGSISIYSRFPGIQEMPERYHGDQSAGRTYRSVWCPHHPGCNRLRCYDRRSDGAAFIIHPVCKTFLQPVPAQSIQCAWYCLPTLMYNINRPYTSTTRTELNIVALAAYDVYRLNTDASRKRCTTSHNVGYIPEEIKTSTPSDWTIATIWNIHGIRSCTVHTGLSNPGG